MPIKTNPVSGQLYVAVLLKMVSRNTTKRPPNESIGTLRGPQSTTAQEKLNTIIKKIIKYILLCKMHVSDFDSKVSKHSIVCLTGIFVVKDQ